ncbi:Gtpase-activating protein gyp7, partial [Thalictrum thalictroides]
GVDPSIRAEVWPFLLGLYDFNSTQEERDTIRTKKRKEYENLRKRCRMLFKHGGGSFKMKGAIGTSIDADSGCSPHGTDSPGSEDVVSARESLSSEGEGLENENANTVNVRGPCASNSSVEIEYDQGGITHRDASTFNTEYDHSGGINGRDCCALKSMVEIEYDHSGIIHADASTCNTESSDSDSSVEEPESMRTFPIMEGSEENDPNSSEDISPCKTESGQEVNNTEDFSTWQRIIRLDAVRANEDWVVYSPAQASVSEGRARRSAEAVGLKDYTHLEPSRIFHAARLVAILEAYALYDSEIGYCQGMSDLLSPIIAVIEEDHIAFWCFVGFMIKARHNFRLDEVGIRRQLNIVSKIIKSKDSHLYRHLEKLKAEDCFFVYRMVVVLFRRELTFEQTVCLWEVMWADQAAVRAGISKSAWGKIRQKAPPTDDLLLYAIAACVLQRRKLIIEKYSSMDEILRECNSMAGQLDVWKLLDDAHDLVVTLHQKI